MRWNKAYGGAIVHVTVNVSARQVSSPSFAADVAQILAEAGIDPAQLTLELTETIYLEDTERALAGLTDIRALGVTLSLDDFGTGYSSLTYLKRFPFTVVKIDRSFIVDIAKDPGTRDIVAAIIDLSHKLGLIVVAEGIETQLQLDHAARLGADCLQGYFLSRPLSFEQVTKLMPDPAHPRAIRLPTPHPVSHRTQR